MRCQYTLKRCAAVAVCVYRTVVRRKRCCVRRTVRSSTWRSARAGRAARRRGAVSSTVTPPSRSSLLVNAGGSSRSVAVAARRCVKQLCSPWWSIGAFTPRCRNATQRSAFSVNTLSLFNVFDYCVLRYYRSNRRRWMSWECSDWMRCAALRYGVQRERTLRDDRAVYRLTLFHQADAPISVQGHEEYASSLNITHWEITQHVSFVLFDIVKTQAK